MATIAFTGNVARPELKDLGGKDACTFSVAEKHQRRNRQTGNYEDSGTTWHRVTYFGNRLLSPQALYDSINQPKTMVLVTGRQETRSYTKDGEERSITEVTADYAAPLQKEPQGGAQRQQSSGFGQPSGGFGQSSGFGASQPPAWEQDEEPPPF